jgi:hypothetical protein
LYEAAHKEMWCRSASRALRGGDFTHTEKLGWRKHTMPKVNWSWVQNMQRIRNVWTWTPLRYIIDRSHNYGSGAGCENSVVKPL